MFQIMVIRLNVMLALLYFNLNLFDCNFQFNHEYPNSPDSQTYLENHESQQKDYKDMLNVEKILHNHKWDTWNPKVQSIEKYLESELNQLPINAELIDKRSKKSKNYDSESETSPLKDHGRKGGADFQNLNSDDTQSDSRFSCSSKFETQKNMMIDSKMSVKHGATLIEVEKIPPKPDQTLTQLEASCMKLCCETDQCDSSILSLKLGDVRIFIWISYYRDLLKREFTNNKVCNTLIFFEKKKRT